MALLAPAAATALALVLQPGRALGAISIFLLGVVLAAALAGVWSGLAASVISLLCLNYYFTEPLHTFRVTDSEDVVALVVFLVVSAIVGSLLARALQERARASRGERESRLLSYFTTKVLSGEPLEQVLDDLAGALMGPLRLVRCQIDVRMDALEYEIVRRREAAAEGDAAEVALEGGGRSFGRLVAVRAPGRPPIEGDDLRLLEAAARQVAVVLEQARLDAQAVTARADAETNQSRATMFSAVAHDFRAPLETIRDGINRLLEADGGHADARQRELLLLVLDETERLHRLLRNLLDLARIEAGTLVSSKEPVAIGEVVRAVVERYQGRAGSVRVRMHLRDAAPVLADRVQIDQVVTNVMENAIDRSPQGAEVTVGVAPGRDGVQVRITDRGPGIAPAERERVFEPFSRASADGRPGSGLGLAIARAIVLSHRGRIRVEGSPTGGASVIIELPSIDTERRTPPRSGVAPRSTEP